MPAKPAAKTDDEPRIANHGATCLPRTRVEAYNLDVKEGKEVLNTRIRKSAFTEQIDAMRKAVRKGGDDPFGDTPSAEIGKKQLASFLDSDDREAAAVVLGVIEDFAREFANAIQAFLKEKAWKDVERVVVGGGFKEGEIGERTIARASVLLKAEGISVDLAPIRHHPDEAGLIGAVELIPSWMLKGYDGMLAVDIGGTNIRAGIVETRLADAADFSKARVWKSDLWRHANDSPSRTETVKTLVGMLKGLMERASKEGIDLAPVIGVGCPGVIESDGSIVRGGQNLPGGNWESDHFNLPKKLVEGISKIGDHDAFIVMHNDAVVQGLSQRPFMDDVKRWGIFTIGTGLGNACFSNGEDKS